MSAEQLGERLAPRLRNAGLDPQNGPAPAEIAQGFRERGETLVQMAESARYCYADFDEIGPKAAKEHLRPVILAAMEDIPRRFAGLAQWRAAELSATMEDCAAAHEIKMGKLGQPNRVAITGGSVSPPIDLTLALIGQEHTLARLDKAIGLIRMRAANA